MGAKGGAEGYGGFPFAFESFFHGCFQLFSAGRVGCGDDLCLNLGAIRVDLLDQLSDTIDGLLEGAIYNLVVTFAIHFADFNDGFDAQKRSQ